MKRAAYRRKNPVIFLMTSIVIILLCCFIFGAFLATAKGNGRENADRYYKSIQIQSGDTLWDIAEEHMTSEYSSTGEYVSELKEINALNSDHIQSGQHLIIVCED